MYNIIMNISLYNTIFIIFKGDLKDLLDKEQREQQSPIEIRFNGRRSLNDLIQSRRIPHTEIGKIQVNSKLASPDTIVQNGDQIEVFPVSSETFANNNPPRPSRFLCDVHLYTLAKRLRLLGFDTAYNPEWHDPELAEISQNEKRTLLSRDRGLLMRNQVESGLLIRNTDPELQIIELLERLGITEAIHPFTRCLSCNGLLKLADIDSEHFKKNLLPQIPESVRQWCTEYRYCQSCLKVFWKGSHFSKMMEKIRHYTKN